jgi:hypothetical protein
MMLEDVSATTLNPPADTLIRVTPAAMSAATKAA